MDCIGRERLLASTEPMRGEPLFFRGECLATKGEGAKHRAAAGSEIGPPAALLVGLDVTGPVDGKRTE